jgi:hypothetical protein
MKSAWHKMLSSTLAAAIALALVGVARAQSGEAFPALAQRPGQLPPAPTPTPTPAKSNDKEINVNWLYGAYISKDVPLRSLNNHERVQLWFSQSVTTWGIYLKTGFFAAYDQVRNDPAAWGPHWAGFGKRFLSHQGQFVIQNSLSALGDGLLGYEPRYDRCRCDGFWPRLGHAAVRNFVTYDKTETKKRLQIPLYLAAFGAGVIQGTWTPNHDLLTIGGRGVVTQVGFGVLSNSVGEFWPEIERIWKRKKQDTPPPATPAPHNE